MAIPVDQLETWAKQGSKDLSSTTYQSVKNALTGSKSPIREKIASGNIRVDLQGSYANDTNTRGDSDVDVLVRLNVFGSNKYSLPTNQFLLHEQTYPVATYDWSHLRRDVVTALNEYYGAASVEVSGNKSIKVQKNNGRLRADIVPVIAHRNYSYFLGHTNHAKVEGIMFYHRTTNAEVINYPDQHYSNGVAKHKATSDAFKRIVRIIKNARAYAVDKGLLHKDTAPSYFLQCMIYNVPNEHFAGNDSTAVYNTLKYLIENNRQGFTTQSGQHALFGNSNIHWNQDDATKTLNALAHLWDNWTSV